MGDAEALRPSRDQLEAFGYDTVHASEAVAYAGTEDDVSFLDMVTEFDRVCDLCVYAFGDPRRDYEWIAALAHVQAFNPVGAEKRVVFLQAAFPPSDILDNAGGILRSPYPSVPRVSITTWEDPADLSRGVLTVAHHLFVTGHLPYKLRQKGRVGAIGRD